MKFRYLFAAAVIALTSSFIPRQKEEGNKVISVKEEGRNRIAAFSILDAKCNVCHSLQNPKKVFTRDNMDSYAGPIYRQVFVWRRMPKKQHDNAER